MKTLIVSYSHRFYSIVATIGIFVFTYRTWVNQIWPEIRVPSVDDEDTEEWTPVNPQVLSVPEISRYLSQFTSYVKKCYEFLLNMRQESPGQFCILMTAVLTALVVIGNCISGVWLSYILVMSIMLGPAFIIHVLPRAQEMLNGHLNSLLQLELPIILPFLRGDDKTNQNSELDEFLPETNNENLEELDKPMISSEVEIGDPPSMPSVNRIEDLLNEEEDDEMALPPDALADEPSLECEIEEEIKEEDLSLQSDQSSSEMRFVATHFDDSDSDDDDIKEFTEGLQFTDSTDSTQLPQTSEEQNENFTAVISAIASSVPQISAVSQNLMTTILTPSPLQQTKRQHKKQKVLPRFPQTEAGDSDLTDFEVVSESELDPGVDE